MAKKLVPSYKLVANSTATSAKAPYLGMVIPVGSIATTDVLKRMVDGGTFMTEATAQYLLEAFYEYCAEKIADRVVRISTGTVSVYPMISGSFDSEDAAFDPARNTLYVGASFSQDVRDAVGTVEPAWGGEESLAAVRLDSEMDVETQAFKTIKGCGNFRLAGRNLTVPDGTGESIGLYDKTGLTKMMDVIVSENDGGQRLTCHLKGDTDLAKGTYKLILVERGLDPTAALATLSVTVTLTEAIVGGLARSSDGKVILINISDGFSTDKSLKFENTWTVTGKGFLEKTTGEILRVTTLQVRFKDPTTAGTGEMNGIIMPPSDTSFETSYASAYGSFVKAGSHAADIVLIASNADGTVTEELTTTGWTVVKV